MCNCLEDLEERLNTKYQGQLTEKPRFKNFAYLTDEALNINRKFLLPIEIKEKGKKPREVSVKASHCPLCGDALREKA